MKCKCGKELSKSFLFCPYCGEKVADGVLLAPFTYLQWYTSPAGRDEFKESWPKLSKMSFSELFEHLNKKYPSFPVWTIGAHFYDERRERVRSLTAISLQNAMKLISDSHVKNLEFEPFEKQVKIVDLSELASKTGSTFYTKTQCEAAISFLEEKLHAER